nr:MAG TPA: hypothetical protein [Caudoviricetes sp.]
MISPFLTFFQKLSHSFQKLLNSLLFTSFLACSNVSK